MDSFKPILPAIKDTASADNPYDDGVMENPYDDGSGNPYDDLIEQEKQVAESARLAAQKAEEDKRLHDLMVKEVWGDCTPGDPVCSPMGKIQTDIKATH